MITFLKWFTGDLYKIIPNYKTKFPMKTTLFDLLTVSEQKEYSEKNSPLLSLLMKKEFMQLTIGDLLNLSLYNIVNANNSPEILTTLLERFVTFKTKG